MDCFLLWHWDNVFSLEYLNTERSNLVLSPMQNSHNTNMNVAQLRKYRRSFWSNSTRKRLAIKRNFSQLAMVITNLLCRGTVRQQFVRQDAKQQCMLCVQINERESAQEFQIHNFTDKTISKQQYFCREFEEAMEKFRTKGWHFV